LFLHFDQKLNPQSFPSKSNLKSKLSKHLNLVLLFILDVHLVIVEWKLIIVKLSWNYLWPPIQDLSTHQVTWRKRLIDQTMIDFVGKQNYEQPHNDDGILDIERWHPGPNKLWQNIEGEISSQSCVRQTIQRHKRGMMMRMMTMTSTFMIRQLRLQMTLTPWASTSKFNFHNWSSF